MLAWAFVNNPRIVKDWYVDIRDIVVHFLKWVVTGFRLFGADVRASYHLTKRIVQGYPLSVRERRLLVRTTSDCLKLIPFSFFIIVPFAELALPFFLRMFPNMLPSTFFEQKYDNATLARKLKAKQEMADFWHQIVIQRTREISKSNDHEYADKAAELKDFQEKLAEGKEFPSLKEILRFSSLFQHEMRLSNMSTQQHKALSKMLGLPTSRTWWSGHLEVQLRHHITNLRREDRDLHWEGIDNLNRAELIEACRKRAIRFHGVTEEVMRRDLMRWIDLSANHRSIPTSLLLWIQSFYLREETSIDDTAQLQLQVKQETKKDENPSEAFQGIAARQKDAVERAQSKLEELRQEIDQVLEQQQRQDDTLQEMKQQEEQGTSPTESAQEAASTGRQTTAEAAEHIEDESHALHDLDSDEKKQMLMHIHKLGKDLKLYKEVVERQKDLLDLQLKFLVRMRDNKPHAQKDADVILLDQRVRLMEMIRSFEQNQEVVEKLMNPQEEEGLDDDTDEQKANAKRWLGQIRELLDDAIDRLPNQPPGSIPDPWADLDASAAIAASVAAAQQTDSQSSNQVQADKATRATKTKS